MDKILPALREGAWVLKATADAFWYYLNRWEGGHPVFSTETPDAGMVQYPVFKKPLTEEGTRPGAEFLLPGTIHYGTPNFPYEHRAQNYVEFVGPESTHDLVAWADQTLVRDVRGNAETDYTDDDLAYANLIVGYEYSAHVETTEVTSAEVSTTAAPKDTPEATFLVHNSGPFKFKRSGQDQEPTSLTVLRDSRQVDRLKGLTKRGKYVTPLMSAWQADSSMFVISDLPYPLTVQLIKLEVTVGGI